MANYIAVVHKDPKSDFGVSFPDFPGCVTAGSSIDEAKDMAHDALSLHIKGMLEDGENIPAPSKLEDIMDDPDYSDAAAILVVTVSETKPRSVRVNITVPEDMLRKIDAIAKKGVCPGHPFSLVPLKMLWGQAETATLPNICCPDNV